MMIPLYPCLAAGLNTRSLASILNLLINVLFITDLRVRYITRRV